VSRRAPRAGRFTSARRTRRGARGFTLIELTIALTLLALMAAVMYGALSLAARSWDAGELKAEQSSAMRQTHEFLRAELAMQYPQRLRKAVDLPLMFVGERDELRFAAALPARVVEGGMYYFRLAVVRDGERSQLVLERAIPEFDATSPPDLKDPERSVLAEGIDEVRFQYFGREPLARDDAPTWRDRWTDKQRLPLLVKVEVKPLKGSPWPPMVVEPRRGPEAGCRAWDNTTDHCIARI
jgi:general secretion pathway protein J